MGIMVPWLTEAARLTGHPVSELSGWRSRCARGTGLSSVECVVLHHTAGPKGTAEAPSLNVVRNGRAGLPGPLSQYVLGRSGTIYVVAAGVANHAGKSEWAGFTNLNSRALGIEAESAGDGVWSEAQRDCYPRLVAALLYYMRRGAERACAHRECAVPKGRKPDPTGIDMPELRRTVARYLTDPLRLIPRGGPAPAPSIVLPAPTEEDPVDLPIRVGSDGSFRAAGKVEVGLGTAAGYREAYVTLGTTWGATDFIVTALGPDSVVLHQWNNGQPAGQPPAPFRLPDNGHWSAKLPDGCRTVTVEGSCPSTGTVPAAALWHVR